MGRLWIMWNVMSVPAMKGSGTCCDWNNLSDSRIYERTESLPIHSAPGPPPEGNLLLLG
jgi:hypothetical protein